MKRKDWSVDLSEKVENYVERNKRLQEEEELQRKEATYFFIILVSLAMFGFGSMIARTMM